MKDETGKNNEISLLSKQKLAFRKRELVNHPFHFLCIPFTLWRRRKDLCELSNGSVCRVI